jgi:addiction module RelE/StbE family toxin
MKVRWLRASLQAVRQIHARIAADNPQAARKVVKRIQSAVSHLGAFPAAGRPGRVRGTREAVVPKLPYIIVYRIKGHEVEILRVFHTSMNWPPLMQ